MSKKLFCSFSVLLILLISISTPLTALAASNYSPLPDFSDIIADKGLSANNSTANIFYYGSGRYVLVITKNVNNSTASYVTSVADSGTYGIGVNPFGNLWVYTYNTSDSNFLWTNSYESGSAGSQRWVVPQSEQVYQDTLVFTLYGVNVKDSSTGASVYSLSSSDNLYHANGSFTDNYHPDDSGGSGSGYDDTSLKGLLSNLFERMYNILLYGNADGDEEDTSQLDQYDNWFNEASESLFDATEAIKLAPDYINDGFTAIENAQEGINELVSGIHDSMPILYYGIVGILDMLIIRKIVGR